MTPKVDEESSSVSRDDAFKNPFLGFRFKKNDLSSNIKRGGGNGSTPNTDGRSTPMTAASSNNPSAMKPKTFFRFSVQKDMKPLTDSKSTSVANSTNVSESKKRKKADEERDLMEIMKSKGEVVKEATVEYSDDIEDPFSLSSKKIKFT